MAAVTKAMTDRKFDEFEVSVQFIQKELFRVEKFELVLAKKATK